MIALWAALAFGSDGWEPVLHDEAYRFCNEPGADSAEARDWCEILEHVPPDRCPGLRATCEGAPPTSDLNEFIEQIRGCGSNREASRRAMASPPERVAPTGCDGTTAAPDASAATLGMRWIAAIFVGLLVLVVLRVLIGWWSVRRDDPVVTGSSVAPAPLVTDLDDVPEGPPDDLLTAARKALAEGRYGDAVVLARGAALRRLAELERVVLHRARTDREYVRSVSKEPAVQAHLREIVGAAELHRWGGRAIDRRVAEGALAAAEQILLLGVALLVVLWPSDALAGRYGPYGDAALHDLYTRGGYDVSWRLRGLQSLSERPPDVLLVDLSEIALADEDIDAVRAYVESGGVLIAGGDCTLAFPEVGDYVEPDYERFDTDDTDWADAYGDLRVDVGIALPSWPNGPYAAFVPASGAEVWVAAVSDALPVAPVVAVSVGSGGVIAVADPRLLRNAALVHPGNEAFLLASPYLGADRGLWALPVPASLQLATRAGEDSDSPFGALNQANLLPAVAQLLLFGSLVALWRGLPFAPLRDPPEVGRMSFAEHVRMLGARYFRLGASRQAFHAVASLWLPRLGRAGLLDAARRAGLDADRANALVDAVEDVAKNPDGPDKVRDLEHMEDLWKATRTRT